MHHVRLQCASTFMVYRVATSTQQGVRNIVFITFSGKNRADVIRMCMADSNSHQDIACMDSINSMQARCVQMEDEEEADQATTHLSL